MPPPPPARPEPVEGRWSPPLTGAAGAIAFALALGATGCSGGGSAATVPLAAEKCSGGGGFPIEVFSDPLHSKATCAFDVEAGAAYVYVPNLAPSDEYVVYVETTGTKPHCVYMIPPGKHPCDLKSNVGEQAPGGSLSATWPLNGSVAPGRYTVSLYDQTVGVILGTVNVVLTTPGN
ncbi:MAG: hypothetical protein JO277_03315 [Candidatus Eremiobacteraeota bacterium]|nr:hypothetical protein [Candidatus Eremiobacteraeota bacterium]